jgi:8-oxo-dGTP pyrophosphatase MutT (NUDIX family)
MMSPFNSDLRAAIEARVAAFTRLDERALTTQELKRAAVALVLAHADDQSSAGLLLTLRAPRLRAHSNQWALPGGRCDPGETTIQTALRELHEELSLQLGIDNVLGVLDDYPTRSGYLITPVVMWADDSSDLVPNPDEVASVHRIALAELLRPRAFNFISIPESNRQVIRYSHFGHMIHAPTAALVYQFSELLAGRVTRVAELEQPVFAWK